MLLATDAINFDAGTGVVTVEGTGGDDNVFVRYASGNQIEVSLDSPSVEETARFDAGIVERVIFYGNDGDDDFTNDTAVRSYAEGGDGIDRLFGGSGDDEFRGGRGEDRLYGRAGNDRLFGEDDRDRLFGDDGDDFLDGGADLDRMYGDDGNDELHGGPGDDRMFGYQGNDRLFGDDGLDEMFGGLGDDSLFGGNAYDKLYGGPGNDYLDGQDGDDRIYAEEGDDQLYGGPGEDRLYGMDGIDILVGGPRIDSLYGGNDDDTLIGEGGEDRLYGEAGHDTIDGGPDNDKVFAGDGDDLVTTGDGDDRIYGEAGNDRIDTGRGRDRVYGNEGDDVINLGDGDDKAYGGTGNDIIRGGDDDDDLRGESGHDVLIGGDGDDVVRGYDDRDLLIGGAGTDEVSGDYGEDILIGGTTSHDSSDASLRAIVGIWGSSDSYEERVNALQAASTEVHLRSGFTVHDDDGSDELDGEQGRDWYFLTGVIPGSGSYSLQGQHHSSQSGLGGGHNSTSPPDLETISDDTTAFDVLANLDHFEIDDDESLHTLIPHALEPTRRLTHAGMISLVDERDVTHSTAASGNWSDASTWTNGSIPSSGARVKISAGTSVSIDDVLTPDIHTIRVDGTLSFEPTVDTLLRVDTLVVMPAGRLELGTEAEPIAGDVNARIVFTDAGSIDRDWDPLALSRGLLMHGSIEVRGEVRTSHVALTQAPERGETELRLSTTPTNWRVGDEIVIAGTSFGSNSHEVREILAIDNANRTVTIDPLDFDHLSPRSELLVDVAHLTRNVVLESEASAVDRRAHTMFMHTLDVDVHHAGFHRLGRTDKLIELDDARLNDDLELISGTGTNARGRYSIHFHRGGTVNNGDPGIVNGITVTDSPGWGIVVHSAYADVSNSVVFDADGAAFVTEAGDEIGSFRNNIAIYTRGSGDGITERSDQQDFAHQGVGFWLQGSGVVVEDNVAVGHAAHGFMFYSRPLEETDLGREPHFPAENLFNPEVAGGRATVPVTDLPISEFRNNVAYASIEGVNLRYHLERATHNLRGEIEGLTLWNNRTGMNVYYSRNLDVDGLTIVTSVEDFDGTGLDHNDASESLTYRNVFIEGYFVGIDLPRFGVNEVNGGYFRNARNIAIVSAERQRSILIRDVTFESIPGYDGHSNIWMITRFDNDDLWALTRDQLTLDYGRFVNARLYFNEQAPDYVPFPQFDNDIPSSYVGKTNEELWSEFGVAVGGAIARDDDTRSSDLINGIVDN